MNKVNNMNNKEQPCPPTVGIILSAGYLSASPATRPFLSNAASVLTFKVPAAVGDHRRRCTTQKKQSVYRSYDHGDTYFDLAKCSKE
ncbi:hypothetical protein CCACVL1_15964 [Corchorus capsularis]|uniref:Uncharacterized protein n=1 Tax=Corchorus capsularis TaxID=210143 RepID=A0A1R3I064_COCAP|nr:hypothetical protein CCACVL1_15964 [Corchorus capsularis]